MAEEEQRKTGQVKDENATNSSGSQESSKKNEIAQQDKGKEQEEAKAQESEKAASPPGQESSSSEKEPAKKEAQKKAAKKKESKPKKTEAIVNGTNLPISTKYAVEICKFIRKKPINKAINLLEEVEKGKMAVPMKGEYGHKKKAKKFASGSGKYPKKASKEFVKILKSLSSNSLANGLEKPQIAEASANIGSRPMARFGMWKRKRTHVKLIAKEASKQGGKK